MPALRAAMPAGIALRERAASDLPFLEALYADTREEELRPVPWPPAQKQAFLADQFGKQHAWYDAHYPGAHWLLVEREGRTIGRIYLHENGDDIRLMDIALLSPARGQGLGTAILRALLAFADARQRRVSLHVEPFNRALRLYERLGFVLVETRGYYQYMARPPRAALS